MTNVLCIAVPEESAFFATIVKNLKLSIFFHNIPFSRSNVYDRMPDMAEGSLPFGPTDQNTAG
jgi:hypothetical protein